MIAVKMNYKKSTKNTHMYVSEESTDAIPTLYIKKSELPKDAPKTVNIQVLFDD